MPDCPVCKFKVKEKNCIKVYISNWNKKEYKLYHCPSCDLQWWEPLKVEPEFYEEEGEEGYAVFHLGISETLGENHKMFFKHFPLKSGRLLDVGCGDGRFLKKAKEVGFEVWGIDFDRKSVQVCREKKGLENVYAMSLEEFSELAKKEGLKFDIITFFEVLEHQDRPREFLEKVKELLKPGGWIAGSVPNRERIFKFERYDFPPNHFLRFNRHSLLKLLNMLGFHSEVNGVRYEFKSLPAYLGDVFLGSFGLKLKKLLKRSAVKDDKLASIEVEDLKKVNPNTKLYFLSLLRKVRDGIFFLPAVVYYFLIPENKGIHLYFQGKLNNE